MRVWGNNLAQAKYLTSIHGWEIRGFAIAEDMQCKDNASASYVITVVITVNWKDALCRNI
jgi:hypothetical protein